MTRLDAIKMLIVATKLENDARKRHASVLREFNKNSEKYDRDGDLTKDMIAAIHNLG